MLASEISDMKIRDFLLVYSEQNGQTGILLVGWQF